jgi:hypothetical protein
MEILQYKTNQNECDRTQRNRTLTIFETANRLEQEMEKGPTS